MLGMINRCSSAQIEFQTNTTIKEEEELMFIEHNRQCYRLLAKVNNIK